MATQFFGGDVWPQLTKACTGRGQRLAAIAYLGWEAPRLLPLRRGDVLVVNASDSALLAHATSPDALESYTDAGVRVSSTPRLHAKVVVTRTQAVIGSDNASTHSGALDEAVVVTDQRSVVAQASEFITGLTDAIPVDGNFLTAAKATWARGRPSRLPGIGGTRPDPGFLPRPPFRVYVAADVESYARSGTEAEVFRQAARRARAASGPASKYSLDSYRCERDDKPFRRNDVLVSVYEEDGELWVWPPVVVVSDPVAIPRTRSVVQIVKGRTDLQRLPAKEVSDLLRAVGLEGRLTETRWIRSTAVRKTLLGAWELDGLD
jgi:hypothetical protein